MQNLRVIAFLLLAAFATGCRAQTSMWAEKIAATVMKTYPDSIVVKKYVTHGPDQTGSIKQSVPATWNYEQGVVLKGFDQLWKETKNTAYFDYMKKMMDVFVRDDGTIRTYDLLEYNIDHVTPGRVLLSLYQETKHLKYKRAADLLRNQLEWQPRTREGGFWHKHRYPYQMWLDGLYMAGPFYAEYSKIFHHPEGFDDVVRQLVWMEEHARDEKTGLLYHAWDESKQQRWANPETGQSPEFWSRAMGWYAMALVDVLDYLPADHPKKAILVAILTRLATALAKYQDRQTGVWFQVTDKGHLPGNYLEASASCMFVYAIAKAVRLGYLDRSHYPVARRGFEGIIRNFIVTDDRKDVHLAGTCAGAGLGGNPYRDGSFEYYIKEPVRTDDLKGIGPFMLASIEIELLSKL